MRAAPWLLLPIFFIGWDQVTPQSRWYQCQGATEVSDLPLVEMPPPHPGATLAVLVTGDGGWRALDRLVADGLHNRGFGIVGLISSRYFATRRTAAESSCALQRIIEHYSIAWRSPRTVAVGYSRGAGVLPFMINRLPQKWRDRVSTVALIGLDPTVDFQVTPFDLLRTRPTPAEVPVRGEVQRLRGKRVLCFYGVNERHSLCRSLSAPLVIPIAEPGSHHFAGNYDQLARTIWLWSLHPEWSEGSRE